MASVAGLSPTDLPSLPQPKGLQESRDRRWPSPAAVCNPHACSDAAEPISRSTRLHSRPLGSGSLPAPPVFEICAFPSQEHTGIFKRIFCKFGPESGKFMKEIWGASTRNSGLGKPGGKPVTCIKVAGAALLERLTWTDVLVIVPVEASRGGWTGWAPRSARRPPVGVNAACITVSPPSGLSPRKASAGRYVSFVCRPHLGCEPARAANSGDCVSFGGSTFQSFGPKRSPCLDHWLLRVDLGPRANPDQRS